MAGKTQEAKPLTTARVAKHYSDKSLKKKIQNALKEAGLDLKSLTTNDLAPVDEFHIRGREATQEMVQKLGFKSTDSVLDVGCGIGGTARYIAEKCNSKVTGIDITPEYIEISKWLNQQVGLDNSPDFIQANATSLPFDENVFDVVITEHVNMNIKNKEKFLSEIYRVTKQEGIVYFYEILAGPNQPVKYPVPWSETEKTSFLASPDEIKSLFKKTNFTIKSWEDSTHKAKAWHKKITERNKKEGPPPLGIHLYLGEKAPEMFQNLGKNLEEKRIKIAQVVLKK